MKTSNYVIYLHIPETDEYYLVHGYSGAVDRVAPEVVKYLSDNVDPNHTWHIKDLELVKETLAGKNLSPVSDEAVEMLKQRGYLTSMSSGEEKTYVEKLAGYLHTKKVSTVAPGFMFVPTYECNLRCPYCFETDTRIELGKLKVLQNTMTEKQVDAAFKSMDILLADRFSGRPDLVDKNRRSSITLYGGESLMLESLPIIEYIVSQGRERNYQFGAITNGVDLHHFAHLLGPGKISYLQITLDGTKEIHNKKRIGPRHKSGTYDRIIANMKIALEAGTRIGVRYHVDFNNIESTNDLSDELEREGFANFKNFSIYTYPIHNFHQGIGEPVYPFMAIHHMHRELYRIRANHAPLEVLSGVPTNGKNGAKEANGTNGTNGVNGTNDSSTENKTRELKVLVPDEGILNKLKSYVRHQLPGIFTGALEPCAATTGLYIFDPFGKIYTCWDSVGMAGHETGTYSEEGPVLNDLNQKWLSRSPATIDECKQCKYAFFHFGGCASNPVGSKGTLFAPACYEFQDNFIFMGQRFFKNGLDEILKKGNTAVAQATSAMAEAEAALAH